MAGIIRRGATLGRLDFEGVYDLVAGFCEANGERVAVVGGMGLRGHGVNRATLDLDLVCRAAFQAALVGFLQANGFETLHRSAAFSNHLHRSKQQGRLDVVYVDEATAQQLFDGSRPILQLGSRRALVPRAEHLIAMKVQAIRNDRRRELQDLADVQALLRQVDVDRDEVRRYFVRAGLQEHYDALLRTL
jgi:hypothetical protein